MENIYTFTEKERLYLAAAQNELLRRLRNVAEINAVQGNIMISPDGSGFIAASS
jgi:hypothetical protein